MEEFLLIPLLGLFILIGSLCQKGLRYITSLIGTLLTVLQLTALVISGRLTDDRFWFHFNVRDILVGYEYLGWKRWMVLPLFIIVYVVIFKSSQWLSSSKWFSKPKRLLSVILILGLILIFGFSKLDLTDLRLTAVEGKNIVQSLNAVGITANQYIFPDAVKASPGKNVIVIYLESIEKAYFHEKLVHLIPNLNELAQTWNFSVMSQGPGSDWSAGSFYTSIYGVPAFFSLGSGGNSIFQNTVEVDITGIGHVYEAAGYNRVFLLGNKEFAGLNDMLGASRFSVKSETDFKTKYAEVPWGLHDMDLFNEAKKEIRDLKKLGKPYVMHLATIGSHGPNGFYDPRVDSILPIKTKTTLHKMVAATDFLLGEFLLFLKEEGYLDNTVVYIMPDHLLMGHPLKINNLEEPRNLFILSNEKISFEDTLHQIDLPSVMLKGAGIKHNAKFLSDYLPRENVSRSLSEKKRSIQQLNELAVKGENLASGFEIHKNQNSITIKAATFENKFDLPEIDGQILCLNLDHKFRIRKIRAVSLYSAFHEPDNSYSPRLIIDAKEKILYAAILYGNQKMVTKRGVKEIVFASDDIDLLREWPYSPGFYQLPNYPSYHSPEDQLLITSSAPGDPQILTPTEIKMKGRPYPIKNLGLYLIKLDGTLNYFNPIIKKDIERLRNTLVKQNFQCLIAHGNGHGPFNHLLSDVDLTKLSNLGKDIAYIAYPYQGLISEHTSSSTLSFSLDLNEENIRPNKDLVSWAQDRTRFIAHAGGSIDGIKYTNSLEALDRAYANGFKLFELDIIQTSDGEFVAAHDWKKWHEVTGSSHSTPVNLKEFLSKTIHGKYTPLDIKRINQWFENHKDAFLITDKINDPIAFAKNFEFSDRLIMELFTEDAINQALNSAIEPMASQQVVQKLGTNASEKLQKMNVRKVALSRQFFINAPDLCSSLTESKIQIYLYQLNDEKQRNEVLVLCHDFPSAFGMYAEDWKFK